MSPGFVLKRLLLAIPTLLGVIVVVFVLLRIMPGGDPIAMMTIGEATPEDVARLRETYGFDKPIAMQFVIYLGNLLHGDFGVSISQKQGVLSLILRQLPATLELAVFALLIAVTLGMALALIGVSWRGRWPEAAIDGISAIALAVPEFVWALLLILFFAVLLPLLPISGRLDPSGTIAFTTRFYLLESLARGELGVAAELIQYLLLPALALALPLIAVIARVLKTSLEEALAQDYILLARVKGFGRTRILLRHALPNALIPTVTVIGAHFIFLVGGTVLVELIFAYPGLGNLLYTAALNRDLPLIQGITIVFAIMFIILNLAVDLTYGLLNARVRQS